MYGTIARIRVKAGMADKLMALSKQEDLTNLAGHVSTIVYKMDAPANEFYLVVGFESKEAYVKNAESPEQDARYREMAQLFDGEPEWHDGEIVYEFRK